MRNKPLLVLCCSLLLATAAWAAKVDSASLAAWAKGSSVPGYSYGGVDEPDPGIYMAAWTNGKEEMIGIQIRPLAEFKAQANQVINRKKPLAFTYKGMPALYTDALAPMGSVALAVESAGKMLVIMNMGQPRAFSQAELVKILDGLNLDKLWK